MKPVIGVMPLWDEEKNSIWMLPEYITRIQQSDGNPIILPLTTNLDELNEITSLCDGFLFTGGQDVNPSIYGECPIDDSIVSCDKRDIMENFCLQKAIEQDKPVLGICRGIQLINAALGGDLYQDIPLQHPSELEHHQKPPYSNTVHDISIKENSPLYKCLNVDNMAVNSYHHQAIKKLADKLEVMAVASDGIIEGIYMPSHKFLWALQWHPEYLPIDDKNSISIFSKFIDAAKDK